VDEYRETIVKNIEKYTASGHVHAAEHWTFVLAGFDREAHKEAIASYPVSKSVLVKDINDFRVRVANQGIVNGTYEPKDALYEFLISQGWTPPTI